MSSRGVFFQETCWLHIPLYFLHFGSWPFNLLIFSMKVLILFWDFEEMKDFVKMKVIVYLIENQTSKASSPVTKILCKKCSAYLAYATVCLNFHKKDSGTLLFKFLEWNPLQSFEFSWLFFSMSTTCLIRRVSSFLFIAYIVIDLSKIKK